MNKIAILLFAILSSFSSAALAQADTGYDKGMKALREHQWLNAVEMFGLASSKGSPRADGALYWRAYALWMLGRQSDANAECQALAAEYPKSTWNSDCESLSMLSSPSGPPTPPRKIPKIHGLGHAVHGENTPDETAQMLALGSQLRSSPADGVAHAKGLLMGHGEVSLKRHVIFVLFQHPSPEAQQLIASLFRGTLGSELQLETIHMVGSLQRRQYSPTLVGLYRESADSEVKRAVISALFVSHDAASLVSLVKSERDPDMERAIVSYLAVMPNKPAVEYMGSLLK